MARFSKVALLLVFGTLAVCSAFKPIGTQYGARNVRPTFSPLRMADDEPGALVVVEKENIEVFSGIAGLVAGSIVGGPFLGVILALGANFISKQDSDAGEAARGIGKTSLEVFNYGAKIFTKYGVGEKIGEATDSALNKLKEYDGEGQVVTKIESTLKATGEKISDLDKQYDLKAKTGEVLKKASSLNSEAINKAAELEKEYKLTDKVKQSIDEAVKKAKDPK